MGDMIVFRAEHMAVSYLVDGRASSLFSDVSFELRDREIYDLVGPSGSGKSTLLRACALMIERTKGELYLNGQLSSTLKPCQWRQRVCLVPQRTSLIAGTVRDNLLLPWKLKVRAGEEPPSNDVLLNLLHCAHLDREDIDRDVSQLSGGQQARVALLRVFATQPNVLLLDEVDAALDDESAYAVGRLTKMLVGSGVTCLRIRHRSADGFASGVFTLRGGKLSYADISASINDTSMDDANQSSSARLESLIVSSSLPNNGEGKLS